MIEAPSAFAPLKERLFRTLWIAAFVSNVGTWMQNVGVSWLAASLSVSPVMISLIQTAASLPALLFSYPAGVISDHADRRRLLIGLQVFLFIVVLLLFIFSQQQWLTMRSLLVFTFLVGAGIAFTTPVWQAITPEVVSKPLMKEAIALNGVNFNLARAIGPALGGLMLVALGIKSIFLFNAVSFLALIAGLYSWSNTPATFKKNSFGKTAMEGLLAVRRSTPFLHLLLRTVSFTAFVSILFAFLPQLSKYQWHQDSSQYTLLWVSLGIGSLIGSYLYGFWNRTAGAATIIFVSCLVIASCLLLLTWAKDSYSINLILLIMGIAWINATSTLNVLAQQLSPAAFKGRFLAVNVTVFQTSIALSSIGWGALASMLSVMMVVRIAAIGMALVAILLLFIPMEDEAVEIAGTVACSDPLLQYQRNKR
ncbi:MFS transporter [Danxiaibacter flavus]|uniref:MFS transporter n=1 Tax=Danxiaibacter flavus TaxID=3049108 RepID=A0ABV3ZLM5_9BACT|nr:MFS transporter [Chitinophagaceae bacterium DXS]